MNRTSPLASLGIIAIAMIIQPVQAATLLHNWTFDSDLTDSVGGKDATAFNGASTTGTSKIGGGAASFDGVNDYLTAGTSSDFAVGTGVQSVSFWFNVADADKATSDTFLATGAGGNTEDGWRLFMRTNAAGTNTDGIDAALSDGGGRRIQGTNANDTIDSLDGNWHLAVAVFDYNGGNGTVDIYLDSVHETTIALADLGTWAGASLTNSHALTFGRRANFNGNYLDGSLDDVAIWSGALSQSEINTLWNGGAGQAAAGSLPPGVVLVDINADGTNETASTADFEDAIGLAPGTFSGESVIVMGGNVGSGAFSETNGGVTLQVSNKTGDADDWFGSGPNDLLEDGFFFRGDGTTNSGTITLSGTGLGLVADTTYDLYLFAGRSQGHETTFTFDVNDLTDPSGGLGVLAGIPVVSVDETLGTVKFTFTAGGTVPGSLVIGWDGGAHINGNQDAVFSGFALVPVTVIPAPAALPAGLAMLGVAAVRRRRRIGDR